MIVPNGPLKTGTSRVVRPTDPRDPSLIVSWSSEPTNQLNLLGGPTLNNKQWAVTKAEPAGVALAPTARRGIVGGREVLQTMFRCPANFTGGDTGSTDADGVMGFGYTSRGFGSPGSPVRIPRTVLVLDSSNYLITDFGLGTDVDPDFDAVFGAAYDDSLATLGLDVFISRSPATFAAAIPTDTAHPVSLQEDIVTSGSPDDPTDSLWDLDFTFVDPATFQGGDFLLVLLSGNATGYSGSSLRAQRVCNYVVESLFVYGPGNPFVEAPAIDGGTLVFSTDFPAGRTSFGAYVMTERAAADAAALQGYADRCRRFAYDAVGLTGQAPNDGGFGGPFGGGTNDLYPAAVVDDLVRNGLPGLTTTVADGDKIGLASYLVDRCLAFFS